MALLAGDAVDVTALAHACGAPPQARVRIRVQPDDFQVDEDCDIALEGEGEHLWCHVEKTGLTTQDAAQALSRAAGVHPRQIGFAGLKDRHAVTRQWFSLAWPVNKPLPELALPAGLRVIETARHRRKLKRGAHRGNRFRLRLREIAGERETLTADLERIGRTGVPNYFGAQRFGHGGRNLGLSRALFEGKRLSRNRRGFALSAARSFLFNAVLHARVHEASWDQLIDGDVVMLDGSHSLFSLADTNEAPQMLEARRAAFDIHPSGPMPGAMPDRLCRGRAAAIESDVLGQYAEWRDGLAGTDVEPARRALRLPVREWEWRFDGDDLELSFWLPPGAFATSVLRELAYVTDAAVPA